MCTLISVFFCAVQVKIRGRKRKHRFEEDALVNYMARNGPPSEHASASYWKEVAKCWFFNQKQLSTPTRPLTEKWSKRPRRKNRTARGYYQLPPKLKLV